MAESLLRCSELLSVFWLILTMLLFRCIVINFLVLWSYYHYYYNYFSPLRAFHTSVSWWIFTGIWVTASLLNSPGLRILTDPNYSLVWMVSTRPLLSKSSSPCTNLFITIPSTPIKLVSPSLSCSIFLQFSSKVSFRCLSVCSVVSRNIKVHNTTGSLFCWLSLGLVL